MQALAPIADPAPAHALAAGRCPMHGAAHAAAAGLAQHPVPSAQGLALQPDDELTLPLNRRVITQYAMNESGARELRLYYDDKEISFDEPELFEFGERLAQQSAFTAAEAVQWSSVRDWPRIRGLLEQLLAEGVLLRAGEASARAAAATPNGARPSPLPPATAHAPRTWDECGQITAELAGRPLEPGWLELVIPVFRVAHMALDAEGRQVGESNVFPPALRLEVPTRWRTCIYPGSRYQVDRPMNVSALKSMRAHWTTMMALLAAVRARYLERFPEARAGWTVGHLERLSTSVLALPTYLLERRGQRVGTGELHPALSSLFRVTDGLRMTLHQMLFVPVGEPTLSADAPMSGAAILAYAERNYSFHSEHGVCAGPRAMIEEFLAVLVDGAPAAPAGDLSAEPALRAALDALDPAMAYGLLGLKAHAAAFSVWPLMTRTYEALAAIVADGAPRSAVLAGISARLQSHIDHVRHASFLASEKWRVDREAVYEDMYRQCSLALGASPASASLAAQVADVDQAQAAAAQAALTAAIGRRIGVTAPAPDGIVANMAACIAGHLARQQRLLQAACTVQHEINSLLGRPQPQHPFAAADLDIHNRLQGSFGQPRLPFLDEEIGEIFGVQVRVDAQRIVVAGPAAADAS